MPGEPRDFRDSARGRRQSWGGAKRVVKQVVALPGVNALARSAVLALMPEADAARLPVPSSVRRVRARMAGVEFDMLAPGRDVVAKELHWGGGRRPRPADQLALDVVAALAREAGLVLDVGAYTGVFSLLSARVSPTAQVHAFEIIPQNAIAALHNVVTNDLLGQVTVHLTAVGAPDQDGTSLLVPSGDGGSALPDYLSSDMVFTSGVHVPVRSLDAASTGWPAPDGRGTVLKIGVEGAENEVLRGAAALVRERRPDVLCELLPGAAVDGLREVLDPLGYRWLLVRDTDLAAHPAPHGHPVHRDWLLTPRTDEQLRAVGVPVAP